MHQGKRRIRPCTIFDVGTIFIQLYILAVVSSLSTIVVDASLSPIVHHHYKHHVYNTQLNRNSKSRVIHPFVSIGTKIGTIQQQKQQPIINQQLFKIVSPIIRIQRKILTKSIPRGGASSSMDDDSDNDDNDDDIDDEMDDDDEMMFDLDDDSNQQSIHESDFSEETMIDRLMVAYKKTPPVTKGYLSLSMLITLYGYLFTKNEFPSILLLDWEKVILKLQFWRLITSFFNFGPFGLGYIMTSQFIWVYMSTLERLNHNKPYDFWIMILFGQLCMVIGYPIMKLSPKFLGHNLSTFLVYIWSRYHEGVEVNMFELFNTRAEMLPWFFLAQTFLLEGEIPILDFLGIVFGHIYHHCKTVGILRAPDTLSHWYETSDTAEQIRNLYKPISSDFDAPI